MLKNLRIRNQEFLDQFEEMEVVFNSNLPWEVKYDLILTLAKNLRDSGNGVDYYDPDTTYEEDTQACYNAHAQRAETIREMNRELFGR